MAKEHTEATCIAFSEIHYGSMKWSITLRQGVTGEDIKGLLSAIKFVAGEAPKAGFRVPGVKAGETKAEPAKKKEPEPKPEEPQRLAQGQNANDNPLTIGSFKVSGTEDAPVVELYSVNKRLKYPVLRVPYAVLSAVVSQKYDVDLSALSVCGKQGAIAWQAEWKPSEKNPKWRDLVDITIPKLTPKKTEEEAAEGTTDPMEGVDEWDELPF